MSDFTGPTDFTGPVLTSALSPMPVRVPLVDARTGAVSVPWMKYLQSRDGGGAAGVAALAGRIAALAALVEAQTQALAAQTAALAALSGRVTEAEHLIDALQQVPDAGQLALSLVAELTARVDGLATGP